ncbi:MAG: Grx4 family monothiol glutaredoxin [Alphaproteobacteria bacterium]|nr:Grx4 family monothiol glutaredoxin [Alphaproteobacteria bacterium]
MTNPTLNSEIVARIKQDLADNPVMLYMKGSPAAPHCGFSNVVVQILAQLGVPYGSADILSDPDLRQTLKDFADWPTFPQLYVRGELIGGCDIVREMFASGELAELFTAHDLLPSQRPE